MFRLLATSWATSEPLRILRFRGSNKGGSGGTAWPGFQRGALVKLPYCVARFVLTGEAGLIKQTGVR
jgi:hypothetical protein